MILIKHTVIAKNINFQNQEINFNHFISFLTRNLNKWSSNHAIQ
jgi:hypothetical protein